MTRLTAFLVLLLLTTGCFTAGDSTYVVNPIFILVMGTILIFLIVAGITKLWGRSINRWLFRLGSSYETRGQQREYYRPTHPMHKWLVEHDWVGDFPGLGSRIASYMAFIFFLVLPWIALVEWMLENYSDRNKVK